MAHYVSELTKFLEQVRKDQPGLEASQRLARARWWDQEQDPEQLQAFREAAVRRGSYVFYPEANGTPGG